MFRDGLLSPRSKLFASTRSSSALSDDLRPLSSASELSLASTATATTKSGVPKDARDTTRRRVRHRDGRLLRGGIGLTTGLGWSDSEDEDAPSPLTRQLSAAQLARRDSKDAAPARALSPLASERSSMSTPTARTLDRARVASVQNALAAAKSALHKAAAARPLYSAPAPPGEGLPTPAASPVLGPSRARADSTRSRQDSLRSQQDSLLSGQDALVRRQDSLASVRSAASSASSLRSSASVGNLTPRRDLPVRPAGTGGIPRKASAGEERALEHVLRRALQRALLARAPPAHLLRRARADRRAPLGPDDARARHPRREGAHGAVHAHARGAAPAPPCARPARDCPRARLAGARAPCGHRHGLPPHERRVHRRAAREPRARRRVLMHPPPTHSPFLVRILVNFCLSATSACPPPLLRARSPFVWIIYLCSWFAHVYRKREMCLCILKCMRCRILCFEGTSCLERGDAEPSAVTLTCRRNESFVREVFRVFDVRVVRTRMIMHRPLL
jgi:hypothetical protein